MKIELVDLHVGVVTHQYVAKKFKRRGKEYDKRVFEKLAMPHLNLHVTIKVDEELSVGSSYFDGTIAYMCTSVEHFGKQSSTLRNVGTQTEVFSLPTTLTEICTPFNETILNNGK